MTDYQMGAIESRFADMIWENEPISSTELSKRSEKVFCWKKSTTYTVLKRLCQKGLLRNEDSLVTVIAPREAVDAQAAGSFVDRAFGGSLPGFLAAFMGGRKLSAAEAEELKQLIDAYREKES